MIALKQLKAFHGLHQNVEALRGRTFKLYQENMAVVGALRKMSSKCPALMARSRTSYLGRGLLHSQQSKFGGCSIAPTGPRHVVLAAAHATRALSLTWSSRRWARRSAQTPALGRVLWLQDSPLRSTAVRVQLSTACSSIGRRPSRFG
jgi:hypothetical protein